MMELAADLLVNAGAAVAFAMMLVMFAAILLMIDKTVREILETRQNERFADNLFNKIEEYRRDFA